jgi:hypothetical protein
MLKLLLVLAAMALLGIFDESVDIEAASAADLLAFCKDGGTSEECEWVLRQWERLNCFDVFAAI